MLRSSSCIVLTTSRLNQAEVFWAKRRPELVFLGGFHAFIGGAMEEVDRQWALDHEIAMGDYLACAARELFEEVGLLFLSEGAVWCGARHAPVLDVKTWQDVRRRCQTQPNVFFETLTQHNLSLDMRRYHPIGHWVTPAWAPVRFETEFFQVHLDAEIFDALGLDKLHETVQVQELCQAQWINASDALAQFESGSVFLTSPTVHYLQHVEKYADPTCLAPVDQGDIDDPLFHAQIMENTYAVPLKSPTLAPATHTNCYVIAGASQMVILDPGSAQLKELAQLYEVLDALIAQGKQFAAIVLTHHHLDHIAGVAQVQARYDVPVWCHAQTARLVASESFIVSRHLEDEAWIELGDRRLQCLETPGHASGHLAFVDERSQWCFVGDVVASFGTILIKPPDGNMAQYMGSLTRLRDGAYTALLPAHGWLISQGQDVLEHYMAHRMKREDKVWDALQQHGRATAPMLLSQVYDDAPPSIWPMALFSLQAHLDHLVHRQLAVRDGSWFVALTST